jgi:predicted nucleotide-binding protein
MDGITKKIDELIAKAKTFTYDNFATKSPRGYAAAYAPDWIIFRQRSQEIADFLGKNNDAARSIHRGLTMQTIGYDSDDFQKALESIMSGLQAAKYVLPNPSQAKLAPIAPSAKSNRIFIVHGHDHVAKNDLENYIKELGLEPVVLHRMPDEGRTVIEKFEEYSDVGFAFIILTPDDTAYATREGVLPDNGRKKESRARQNVVFEFGYFVGRLSRKNVCCLYTGGVTLPSDVHGILYKEFHKAIKEVFYDIKKELEASGYKL